MSDSPLSVSYTHLDVYKRQVYYTTLGETKADTVLLAVNVATDTGDAMGAVRTSNGTYLPHIEDAAPTALQGPVSYTHLTLSLSAPR